MDRAAGTGSLVSLQAPSVAAHLPSPRMALLQALPMPLGMSCGSRLALHADGGAVMRHLTLDAKLVGTAPEWAWADASSATAPRGST